MPQREPDLAQLYQNMRFSQANRSAVDLAKQSNPSKSSVFKDLHAFYNERGEQKQQRKAKRAFLELFREDGRKDGNKFGNIPLEKTLVQNQSIHQLVHELDRFSNDRNNFVSRISAVRKDVPTLMRQKP